MWKSASWFLHKWNIKHKWIKESNSTNIGIWYLTIKILPPLQFLLQINTFQAIVSVRLLTSYILFQWFARLKVTLLGILFYTKTLIPNFVDIKLCLRWWWDNITTTTKWLVMSRNLTDSNRKIHARKFGTKIQVLKTRC